MGPSRYPSSSTSSGGDGDPLGDLLTELTEDAPPAPPRPHSARASARPSSSSTPAQPPATSRSLPAAAVSGIAGGGHGMLHGKESLFRCGASKEGVLCAGLIGGPRGTRFCCKDRLEEQNHCGVASHGRYKQNVVMEAYYIKAKDETALCFPFVSMADLVEADALALVRGKKTTHEWHVALYDFLIEHKLVEDSKPEAMDDGSLGSVHSDSSQPPQENVFFGKDDASDAASKRSASGLASVESRIALSRSAWRALRPSVVAAPQLTGDQDSQSWFKPFLAMSETVKSVAVSIEDMIELIPSALSALDNKMEEFFVSKAELEGIRVPFRESQAVLETATDLLWYGTTPQARNAFNERYGSVILAIRELSELIEELQHGRGQAIDEATGMAEMDAKVFYVAQKAAKACKAVSQHAAKARQTLDARIAALELNESSRVGHSQPDPLDDMFAEFTPGTAALPTPPPGAPSHVSLGTVNGEAITLEWLVNKISVQEQLIEEQRREIVALKSSTYARGVKVDSFSFDDINGLLQMIVNENIDPDNFAGGTDATSLWVHFPGGNETTEKSTNELKTARGAGITDPICCAFIASFRQKFPPYMLGDAGKPVSEGSRFPMLMNRTAWEGKPSLEGGRKALLRSVKDAVTAAKQYINDFYPHGPLRDLLLALAVRSHDWWVSLAAFIEDEILTLSQFGIPEEKVFTLVCDELQIIFRKMFERRMKMQVFAENRDKQLYFAKALWITMQCHMVMDEFEELGFGTHVLISSLFTRFLAEQTGANFAAGMAAKLDRLEQALNALKTKLETRIGGISGKVDAHGNQIKSLQNKCGGGN